MEQKQEFVDVLAIIPDGETRDNILGQASDNKFAISAARTFDDGQAVLSRQGYRYRIVVVDIAIADGMTDWIGEAEKRFPWIAFVLFATRFDLASKEPTVADAAKALDKLMVRSNAQTLVAIMGGESDAKTIANTVMRLLEESRDMLPSLPVPPYQAGTTRFLREVGPLLISVSLTSRPWVLEGDVFTLPVSNTGMVGDLGAAWKMELGTSGSQTLEKLIKGKVSTSNLRPESPVHDTFNYVVGSDTRTITLILATSAIPAGRNVMSAVGACIAAIVLATSLTGCRTLILPVIGGGTAGLAVDAIVRGVLEEFDPKTPLGQLKHVIMTVYEPEHLEVLTDVRGDDIARVQKLENDLPSGPDRLQVESEVYALADAIALKELEPPLVVGILGGWGAGKSFVLHLLRERLREIRCWDLSDETVRNEFPYVGHPYLIHFDAWTYAKSNLWASLMQRILLDLDQQLGLEQILAEARSGLLLEGVDIWHLLEDLTKAQREVLKEDLGAEAIKAFDGWKKGDKVAESLWGVLKLLRDRELTELEAAKDKLTDEEKRFAVEIATKRRELDDQIAQQRRLLDQQLARKRNAVQIEVAKEQAKLETAKRVAIEETDEQIDREARNEAWGPAASEIKNLLGQSVDGVLRTIGAEHDDAPLSIYSVVKEIKLTTKYGKGLLQSKSSIAFLVFAILSPGLAWMLSTFDVAQLLTNVVGSGGVVGGLLGSAYGALTKLNRGFEEQQTAYEKKISEAKQTRGNQRDALLQRKVEDTVLPIERAIHKLEAEAKTEAETREAGTQTTIKMLMENGQRQLEELKQSRDKTLQDFSEDVQRYERRAGLTGRGKSLLDVVLERRESGYYEEKLGVLHEVQQDLREITEALVPVDGCNRKFFPRGMPRIILVVDDLDRCPPDKVVQMLEAAQLLVKTRLFVVVLAMDVRYVTRALEKEYREILVRDGDPSGLDYIEKIVQIPYRVPGIAPGVMRSFLQDQMDIVQTGKQVPSLDLPDPEISKDDLQPPASSENPVFKSSFDPLADEPTKPLPNQVQQFDEVELTLLTDCCNAADVSPRAGRRLVNVFKLMKIIWYHRGLHREPDHAVKRVMIFLLALSSAQPVIMRQVLHFLEEEYRDGDPTQEFKKLLLSYVQRSKLIEGRPETHSLLVDLIETHGRFPPNLTLEMIDLDNIRLVKSFSFVGEVDTEKRSREENGPPPEGSGTQTRKTSARKKKTGTTSRRRSSVSGT